jgi:hypothetical protein
LRNPTLISEFPFQDQCYGRDIMDRQVLRNDFSAMPQRVCNSLAKAAAFSNGSLSSKHEWHGLLFSPGRGLFLYFLFAAVGLLLILRQRSLLRQGLPAALAASIVSGYCSDHDGL